MEAIALIIFSFLFIRLFIVILNYITDPNLKAEMIRVDDKFSQDGLLSVLIPVRNEETNIKALLHDLSLSAYKNLEIIIYDDSSRDSTVDVVKGFCQKDSRIKIILGDKLPQGWLGKNHACHRLAEHASGTYYLFMDADVRINERFINVVMNQMTVNRLDMLSIFPTQQMQSTGERLVVPLMNQILISLLPLFATRSSKRDSFSAANGQFMMFKEEVYNTYRLHYWFKDNPVEDIAMMNLLKKWRYKCQTMLGGDLIYCRMYNGFSESIDGFSKNVLNFFGGSFFFAFVFACISLMGFIPVFFYMSFIGIISYVIGVFFMYGMIAALSRRKIFKSIVYVPLQRFVLLYLVVVAGFRRKTSSNYWKGRRIY